MQAGDSQTTLAATRGILVAVSRYARHQMVFSQQGGLRPGIKAEQTQLQLPALEAICHMWKGMTVQHWPWQNPQTESHTSTCICMCVLYKCIIQHMMLGGPQITWGGILRDRGKCPQVCNQYWGNTQVKGNLQLWFFPPKKKIHNKNLTKIIFKVPSNLNYTMTLWFYVLISI